MHINVFFPQIPLHFAEYKKTHQRLREYIHETHKLKDLYSEFAVQLLGHVQLCDPMVTEASQASLPLTISQNLLKLI